MSEITPPGDSYPVTDRNQLRRVPKRGRYDREAVWRILDSAMVCHVAFVVDGQPYCFPTTHWRIDDRLYWHGAAQGRLQGAAIDGARVCLTVTHLDALVLARTAFSHSVDYRSAMCFGAARVVTDPDERARALDAMIDRFYPGRVGTLRPLRPAEIKATSVVEMTIEEASAKIRDTGLGDEGDDPLDPVWAARLPTRLVIGDREPSPRNPAGLSVPGDALAYSPGRSLDEALLESARTFARTLSKDE